VGQPIVEDVTLSSTHDLRHAGKTPQSGGVQNPVAILLEAVALLLRIVTVTPVMPSRDLADRQIQSLAPAAFAGLKFAVPSQRNLAAINQNMESLPDLALRGLGGLHDFPDEDGRPGRAGPQGTQNLRLESFLNGHRSSSGY